MAAILAVVVILAAEIRADTTLPLRLNPAAFKLPPLTLLVALNVMAEIMLAPVILPVPVPVEIIPFEIILPVALALPVTVKPSVVNTATFDTPFMEILALPLAVPMLASEVPLKILLADNPVSCDPLPMK